MWLILIIILIIFTMMIYGYLKRTKCPQCKSRQVAVIQKKQLYVEDIFFKETVKIKEYDNKSNSRSNAALNTMSNQYLNPPQKIITQEVVIPGKRIWHNVQYECKKCHTCFSQKEFNDIKTKIIQ